MDQYIRALFPAAQNYTYLNSASIAPLPVTAVRAVAAQLEDVSSGGSVNFWDWHAAKNRARELTASMLGVHAEEIAFLRNTSDGFCSVAAGMNWRKGDNIVTFAGEFPANYYPWRGLRDNYGVEIRACHERGGGNGGGGGGSRIDIDELTSLIDQNTKLVAVSAVQYSSGFSLDLERIGSAVRKTDALFAVDIIQAFGVTPFDLPAQYIDIAAGASYKWLCAPEGCGIFYLGSRAREQIKPASIGWMSVEEPWDFANREQGHKSGCLAWETGMCGSALFYGLEQSLALLRKTGVSQIATYLEELTDFLCEILPARYEIVSSRIKGEKSQIVSIRPINGNGATADSITEHLRLRNIIVSSRGGCIRIAPHFFNNFRDIERLVEYLP